MYMVANGRFRGKGGAVAVLITGLDPASINSVLRSASSGSSNSIKAGHEVALVALRQRTFSHEETQKMWVRDSGFGAGPRRHLALAPRAPPRKRSAHIDEEIQEDGWLLHRYHDRSTDNANSTALHFDTAPRQSANNQSHAAPTLFRLSAILARMTLLYKIV